MPPVTGCAERSCVAERACPVHQVRENKGSRPGRAATVCRPWFIRSSLRPRHPAGTTGFTPINLAVSGSFEPFSESSGKLRLRRCVLGPSPTGGHDRDSSHREAPADQRRCCSARTFVGWWPVRAGRQQPVRRHRSVHCVAGAGFSADRSRFRFRGGRATIQR